MPRESPYFNCGELKPVRISSFPGGSVIPGGTRPGDTGFIIVNPRDPIRVLDPRPEQWVCVCRGAMEGGGCVERANRGCEVLGPGGPAGGFPYSTTTYRSQAECEGDAFDKYPCALSFIRCDVVGREPCNPPYCTDPVRPESIDRSCTVMTPVRERVPDPNNFTTIAECNRNCPDEPCLYIRRPSGYKCVETTRTCPNPPYQQYRHRECVECDCYDPLGGSDGCRFSTKEQCQALCSSDPCNTIQGYKCVVIGQEVCPEPNRSGLQRTLRDCIPCIVGVDEGCSPVSYQACRTFTCLDDQCGYGCVPEAFECFDPTTNSTIYLNGTICDACILGIGANCLYRTANCDNECYEPPCKYECFEDTEPCPGETGQLRIIKRCKPCVDPTNPRCEFNSLSECENSGRCENEECDQQPGGGGGGTGGGGGSTSVSIPAGTVATFGGTVTSTGTPTGTIGIIQGTITITVANTAGVLEGSITTTTGTQTGTVGIIGGTVTYTGTGTVWVVQGTITYTGVGVVGNLEGTIQINPTGPVGIFQGTVTYTGTSTGTAGTIQGIVTSITVGTTGVLEEPTTPTGTGYFFEELTQTCKVCSAEQIIINNCPYSTLDACLLANIRSTGDPQTFIASKNFYILNRDTKETIDFDKASEQSLYENVEDIYNFYEYIPNESTNYVKNNYYLNIFNDMVAKEVYFFLNRNYNDDVIWNEQNFYNLTIAKISISLKRELVLALCNLHDIDGSPIDPDNFYYTIKKLLITNRIHEFDPSFYIQLYIKQQNDKIINYRASDSTSKEIRQRVGLGILSESAISSDPDSHETPLKFTILRRKRFNTDINASLSVTTEDAETIQIPLKDGGIQVDDANDQLLAYVPIGTGDDYFISFTNSNDQDIEIKLQTDVDRSWFVPESIRIAALKAFDISAINDIYVSSLPNQHEFVSSYQLSSTPEPMYFALNLSTVNSLSTTNLYVTETTGVYQRLIDPQKIEDHIVNYGLTSRRLNVDYRDPFFHYAKQTGKISVRYNDITFKYFDSQVDSDESTADILTRVAPFAIVVVPGCGSRHNPYHNISELEVVSGTVVKRKIQATFNMDITDEGPNQGNLKETITNPVDGVDPLNKGFANRREFTFDPQFYSGTYYVDGSYRSSPPTGPIQKPVTSHVVNTIIDNLIIAYNPKELKWFDIYSRLNLFQMGEYLYTATSSLLTSLSQGWRGVKVKNVTRSRNDRVTYIDSTIVPEVVIPQPIITKENRYNATSN